MNRRLFLQVTAPALLIGLLLLGACLASAWYITRLQKNMTRILSQNVASLRAAQELEIRLRQLRFHSFLHLIDPAHAPQNPIIKARREFQEALEQARALAESPDSPPESRRYVRAIAEGYQKYKQELAGSDLRVGFVGGGPSLALSSGGDLPLHRDLRTAILKLVDDLRAQAARPGRPPDFTQLLDQLRKEAAARVPHWDFQKWVDDHPIRYVVKPCQELLDVNRQMMHKTFQESEDVSAQARGTMLLVGLVGPVGGLLIGFGMARGLSRSLYQLSVRVQGMAQRLDQDVASVQIAADGDLRNLDQQLDRVVQRVEEVAERLQRHQRDMLRAEQLSAVGQLAAGVAHEIRNPLTSVNMLVDAALRSHNRKPLTLEDLQVIHGEINRLKQTVQSFLDFARPPTLCRSLVPLGEVINQALDLVRVRARQQQVETVVHGPDETVPVSVDRGQLCTVLVNLFLNALDAMPRGGRLEVDLETEPKTGVRIRVRDTGSGISPDILGRLFTPFASSKPTGTGLGLSISRRIIEEHGGRLEGGNRPEGGACFTIVLPASGEIKKEVLGMKRGA